MRAFIAAAFALLSTLAAADATVLYTTPASSLGTYERGVIIPNTRDGGNWKTTVNVYTPSGSLVRALVEIPGATGNADTICLEFHECFRNPVTAASQVNWSLLGGENALLITVNTAAPLGGLDQCNAAHVTASINHTVLTVGAVAVNYFAVAAGQTVVIAGVSTGLTIQPFGTNGTTGTGGTGTYALSGDGGVVGSGSIFLEARAPNAPTTTTSCNFSETSGQDDLEFYLELSDWISSGCTDQNSVNLCGSGIGTVGQPGAKKLIGFSNGSMMVNRVWCQNDSRYSGYAAVSGPVPTLLNTKGCPAPTPRPYIAWYGGLDPDLGICTAAETCPGGNNWGAATWTGQNPTPATLGFPTPASYVAAPIYFCTFSSIYGGTPACAGGGAAVPPFGDPGFAAVATHTAVTSGFVDQYCYGGASCPMQLNYVYQGSHGPPTQAAVLGYQEIGKIIQFFKNNPS